ncbi:hypothetical protein INS49_012862 [Diaporthe citri]|uniref:uncharacterized protein n=1 Tax=Diaporthe citri TaxID=83186 RepID=UPI001C7F1F06|nr:uncharacterized protein INS49_012862 [Diaporthe citri]KAG6359341.1 hypothetical protein INS49_012862 [Diaporthe citri]
MAESRAYDDKEEPAMPIHTNTPGSLPVVTKETDQRPNDSSAISQNGSFKFERLPASLPSDIEPQSLGQLGILDLADELLINIFGHAKDSADIRNIRLTCRRFCSTSSHLLLDCLDLCLTAASLARAQEISCHPIVSKGIRVLHISLKSRRNLRDTTRFMYLAIQDLRGNINSVLRNPQSALENGNFASSAEFQPIFVERQRLLGSWCQYTETRKCSTHQQRLDVEVLRRGYEKYRMTYEWQRRTIKDGTYTQAIAAAVGRISRVTKLLFTNKFRYREGSPGFHANLWRHHTSASDVLDERMMLSIGASLGPEVKPTELTAQVPLALHAAGFPAAEVEVQYVTQSGIWPNSTWIGDQAQLHGLKAAAESLKVFTFEIRMWCSSPSEHISSASTYLRAVLEAANLEVLTLSVPSTFDSDEHIGSLLASLRWPHLREINLAFISFHLSELKRFVEGFRPGIFLNLKRVELRSGSWAEGLDVLRTKANPESQVGSLSGAECNSMASDQLQRILDGGQASLASQYVQGVPIRNPFLVTQDETIDEETNTDTI